MTRNKRSREFHSAEAMKDHINHELALIARGRAADPIDERVIALFCRTCGDDIAWEEVRRNN